MTTTNIANLRPGKLFAFRNTTSEKVKVVEYVSRKAGNLIVKYIDGETFVDASTIELVAVDNKTALSSKPAEKKVTKASIVREIVAADLKNGLAPKLSIIRIMNEFGMSKAGASTYYYNAKKVLV